MSTTNQTYLPVTIHTGFKLGILDVGIDGICHGTGPEVNPESWTQPDGSK